MRQLLLTPTGVRMVHTPRPVLRPGTVLVRVLYSMVSVGTETASIRRDPDQGLLARADALAAKGLDYARKAIANPEKAAMRLRQIAAAHASRFIPQSAGADGGMADTGSAIGYSVAGEVIDIGSGITDIRPGDLVACAGAGEANHADVVCVRKNLVTRLPPGMPVEHGATVTLGAIAMQGVRRAAPQIGERIAVIGLGLLGQITVDLLRAAGCQVMGLDTNAERVKRAISRGMTAGTADPADFSHLVLNKTAGMGADAVIVTAAGKSDAIVNGAIASTRRKGRVVLVGDVGLGIERSQFYVKELDLLMSTSYGPGRYDAGYEEDGIDYPAAYVRWTVNRNMSSYLELAAKGSVDVAALIDVVVKPEQAPAIYAELASPSANTPLGVLIDFRQDGTRPQDVTGVLRLKPSPAGQVRVGFTGAGNFGAGVLLPALRRQPGITLAAIIGRDSARTANMARMTGAATAVTDFEAACANSDIDLMMIATRHFLHADQVQTALRHGKATFVEKPLCLTWDELRRIEALCQEMGSARPLLMVGYNRRFSPAARILHETLSRRSMPLQITYRVNAGQLPTDHWTLGAEGGGRNLGEACHMYDFCRFLTGSPVAGVSAMAARAEAAGYSNTENFTATISYQDGSMAAVTYTAMGHAGLPKERIEVFCGGEAFVLDDYHNLTRASDGRTLWQSGSVQKGHTEEMQALVAALREDGTEPIPLEELLETSAVSLGIEDCLIGADGT